MSPFGGVSCYTRGAEAKRALAKVRFLGLGPPTTLSIHTDLLCAVMRFACRWSSDALWLSLVCRQWGVCASKLTTLEVQSWGVYIFRRRQERLEREMILEREMMQVPVVPLHVPRVPRMTDDCILARIRRRRQQTDEARKTAARKELNELEERRENGQGLDWDELAGLGRNRKRKFMSL